MDRHAHNEVDATVSPTDEARRPADRSDSARLLHLSETDQFEVAKGEPDIDGWDVKDTEGRKLGEVEDLLVDTGDMRVRYIEVHLEKKIAREEGDARRYVLVPVGAARLDDDNDDVIVDLGAANIPGLPAYSRGSLTREYETSLLERYGSRRTPDDVADRTSRSAASDEFYSGRHFDDSRFFGSRRKGRETSPYISRRTASR